MSLLPPHNLTTHTNQILSLAIQRTFFHVAMSDNVEEQTKHTKSLPHAFQTIPRTPSYTNCSTMFPTMPHQASWSHPAGSAANICLVWNCRLWHQPKMQRISKTDSLFCWTSKDPKQKALHSGSLRISDLCVLMRYLAKASKLSTWIQTKSNSPRFGNISSATWMISYDFNHSHRRIVLSTTKHVCLNF